MKPIPNEQETGDKERSCIQEGPTEPSSDSYWHKFYPVDYLIIPFYSKMFLSPNFLTPLTQGSLAL